MTSRVIGHTTALAVSLAVGSILAGCGSAESSGRTADPASPASSGTTSPGAEATEEAAPTPENRWFPGVEPATGPRFRTYSTTFRLLEGWRADELSTQGQMVAGDRLGPRQVLMRDWPAPTPLDEAATATIREHREEGRFRRLADLTIPGCTAFQVAGRDVARDTAVVAVGCPHLDRDLYFEFKERGGSLESVQGWMARILSTLEHR